MKVYIITDDDLSRLVLSVDRNPQHGMNGGGSRGTPTPEQLKCEEEAHSFFQYQLRRWIREISSSDRK